MTTAPPATNNVTAISHHMKLELLAPFPGK